MLKAILLFHIRVGARLAIQSFVPLFCAMVVLVMLAPVRLIGWLSVRLSL